MLGLSVVPSLAETFVAPLFVIAGWPAPADPNVKTLFFGGLTAMLVALLSAIGFVVFGFRSPRV